MEGDSETTAPQREQIMKAFNEALPVVLRDWRTNIALTFLSIWLIPVLAVVVLGSLIDWVYRGFKGRGDAS
jgi:hypothetical protein